ncbi:aspartate-semialdehyde dehydrogenase [Campylobacter canadensis]|uniref:Aspartate-semialdehyde dehydrogenase n=1 Tax=Campylobacter canadensis TaxID=449520 RepID=A0ABS7WTX4_9BACT|nr:aspartate-semialdehyde dehydrogenase [Campylobacter canadensis]MBZ7987469.1 aspartate-semialdehyde dehydrogenase [Campylobacter canadensis]MBZ7994812.1 aspartate-semialdehyde dehydrogenase [Campylobacter canadensis]MBZ7996403.1 aspartate-semialdehyde dehydrogenase [Campylobacter canadensis]MBZ7998437.1 aspartate-semialdehyde dehydrogenase [Campylobacter canadensis]MBZ8000151.1 aspartate-semialdehyde dehydrogenase [Campylobacter canadensis]
MKNYAVVGASGAVGEEILKVLDELDVKVNELYLFASKNSAGKKLEFKNKEYTILELTKDSFKNKNIDVAFFCAGSNVSKEYAKYAVDEGIIVIDNTSYFRMNEDVPLVVPECNKEDIKKHKNIIANPNCSTIQMVHILKPLDDAFDIKSVNVSTYQAASGAGNIGMQELLHNFEQIFSFKDVEVKKFSHQLAFNLIPQIDDFTESGYTKEELKMINETQKIMHKKMQISATCVRVPVLRSHSESISITFNKEVDLAKAKELLKNAPSVVVIDDVNAKAQNEDNFDENNMRYPMPLFTSDTNETYVGRIRLDLNCPKTLHLWCVADQIRVGAATNAVRIAKNLA